MLPPDFRARRPPSPTRSNAFQPQYPPSHSFTDADERRAAARLDTGGRGLRKHHPPGGLKMSTGEWKLLLGIIILAAGIRLFRISKPNSVVFDEVHFGKFASKYLKTRYYVDVHPPLAKLLITLVAALGGYDGEFEFKEIGKLYENVPYITMRLLPATMGLALVPLTYMTIRALDCRATTAMLGSLFVAFENGLITQSRLILLDSPLLFFTGLTTFFWVGFCNEDRAKPFTEQWWSWLALTGLSLGAVVSCKWVGLFTIATIGLSTIRQLWLLIGDLHVSPRIFFKHFMARAVCLIIIPILFYMAMFEIHFLILRNSGDGDGFMSSEFQHTLHGRGMQDTFADVALGSQVTIRHVNTQGGYLHSHPHNYPGGSTQQQITLYPHKDGNNDFRVLNATQQAEELDGIVYVTNGMQIRLQHIATEKRLHSHDMRPPVSEVDFQNEVSGYGFAGFSGDANDNWIVEIDDGDKKDPESFKRLRTLRSRFRLRHLMTGCYLFSHKVKLPDWGFEQQEVTCNKQAVKPNSLWVIETNAHELLPGNAEKVNYRLPGFFRKFIELQVVMWRTNAGLTERHTFDSRPQAWPILRRGINFWVQDHRQIYLIGNPTIWWLSSIAVLMYLGTRALLVVRAKRGYKDFNHSTVVKYDQLCGFLVLGWGLHYFPFYLMQRQLFLHHYFPALYFAILTFAAVFDLLTSTLRPRIRLQIAAALLLLAVWNYLYFSPLTYGNPWTKKQCNSAKWLKTWDFSCNDFLDESSQYKTVVQASPGVPSVTTIAGGREPVIVPVPHPEESAQEGEKLHTTVAIKEKIEPGRDVFQKGVQEAEPMTTKGLPLDQMKVKDSRTDSTPDHKGTVMLGPPSPSDEAVRGHQVVNPAIQEEKAKEGSGRPQDSTKPEKVIPTSDTTPEDKNTLAKEELEADRVRQNLYGKEG